MGEQVQRGWKGRTFHIELPYPLNIVALLIFMRRTAPVEPVEPIEPADSIEV